MAHFKTLLYIFLDFLGLGAATIQVAAGLDQLLKSQEENVIKSGLTDSHEEVLFWFNMFKVTVIFLVVVGYYCMRGYVYWKKNIKESK
jgi:hypothetical protein